ENSVTVSWTKPKSDVSGFKITYTHSEEDEPVSVWVESDVLSYQLSRLAPGSSYEVTLISTLGLQESDAITDLIMTLPDPPTDLRVMNVTEHSALLSWQPALASIDKYTIVYGPDRGNPIRISTNQMTVWGNVVEHQLRDLTASTTYTVTISSQLGALQSSSSSSTFTTTSTRNLQATNVTPRTATLSWIPPYLSASSYRLTYQTEGAELRELILDGSLTQLELKRLVPGSLYVVHLQAEFRGEFTEGVSTRFTTGTLLFPFPSDCSQELLNGIFWSSELEIYPLGELGPSLMVYCDMETDGGGWTVLVFEQKRKDGSVDFFRGWKDYVKGFGDPNGEFWLGLQALNNLTSMTKMSLRVDLGVAGESAYAHYSQFEVGKRNYRLTVGGYSGTAGDSLSYHNQRPFSTRDRDLAPFITRCAMSYRGGWWYKNCHQANLNGLYGVDVRHQGIIWTSWKGKDSSMSFTEMKVRPTTFKPPPRG
uniref:Tenascin XB n=1 Tax=Gouania willdenowi TaxID=441366 RepID=A0A8C5NEG6_GOUWI